MPNKLWLLHPNEKQTPGDNPWEPWYNKVFCFVVCADSERQARGFAQAESGDEKDGGKTPWLLKKYSTCHELTGDFGEGVVVRNFKSA